MRKPVKNKYGRVSISNKYPSGEGHKWHVPKSNRLRSMDYKYSECSKCKALAVKAKGYSYWRYSFPLDAGINEEEHTYYPRSCSSVINGIEMNEAFE